MVGGSTRIPRIRDLVSQFFDGKQLSHDINEDEAVAYGAAVMAANLAGQNSGETANMVTREVLPRPLGMSLQALIASLSR